MRFDEINREFRAKVIIGLAGVATLALLPMAILRFVRREYLIGLFDLGLIAIVYLCPLLLRRGVDPTRVGLFTAILVSSGAAVVNATDPARGVMWTYVVIIANFLLTRPRWAATLAGLLVLGTMLHPNAFDDITGYFGYLFTTLVVVGFAAVFAWRTDLQARQLQALAMRDPLTDLQNRRALLEHMEAIGERRSDDAGTALLVLDIDRFKQINDTWGHDRGDKVLRDFADLVRRSSRGGDELYRLGGEEFVLLLPATGLEGARVVAGHLLEAVRNHLRAGNQPVTVSIGVSQWRAGEEVGHWLARTDALMYRAKRRGRDQAVVEGEEGP